MSPEMERDVLRLAAAAGFALPALREHGETAAADAIQGALEALAEVPDASKPLTAEAKEAGE